MKKWTQSSIIESVQKQIRKRVSQKYNWKRTVSSSLVRLEKVIFRFTFRRARFSCGAFIAQQDDLGLSVDESGRSIAGCLREYVNLLINRGVKLHTLLILGSRAKGRGKPESDVDVMVIASDLPGRKMSEFTNFPQKIMNIRQQLLLTDFPLCIGVQSSSNCSREEFLQWLREFKVAALDAVYYGKVIYDDGFWSKVMQNFKEIEKKFRLRETTLREMLLVL
jgi:predicted nucleotidyltransferase